MWMPRRSVIRNQTIYIPDYFDRVQSMPDDPMDSVAYMVQSEYATCPALLYPTDESASLPRTKGALINGVRQFLTDNQGLIHVEAEKDYLYMIVKTRIDEYVGAGGVRSVFSGISADFVQGVCWGFD